MFSSKSDVYLNASWLLYMLLFVFLEDATICYKSYAIKYWMSERSQPLRWGCKTVYSHDKWRFWPS